MSGRAWLRAGPGVLAGGQVLLGLWVLPLPELFWKWPWVSHLPPCNEHLLRDFGGASSRSPSCCARRWRRWNAARCARR
ncbi:hypothetical protein SOM70_16555 [Streptomyces salinarius]|uniref:hypothetical protein n=1 Tax=Streptomyces salinarius TaxID=2762598 RepID=UPI0032DE4F44